MNVNKFVNNLLYSKRDMSFAVSTKSTDGSNLQMSRAKACDKVLSTLLKLKGSVSLDTLANEVQEEMGVNDTDFILSILEALLHEYKYIKVDKKGVVCLTLKFRLIRSFILYPFAFFVVLTEKRA